MELQKILGRNKLFNDYFNQHFRTERIVGVLTSAGQWEMAIEYLESKNYQTGKYRWIYLGTVINTIYASKSLNMAASRLIRALKKAFEKISLEPGASSKINIELGEDAFSFYDDTKKRWVLEPGKFTIMVGSSSKDIRLTSELEW